MVVIGILAIVLTLSDYGPLYPLVRARGLVFAAAAGATLLPAVAGMFISRRALRVLERYPENPSRGQAIYGRGMFLLQTLLGVCHAAVLLTTDWMRLAHEVRVIGQWPVVGGLLALVPFLLSVLLGWLVVYPADRAVRQIAVEVYLLRGKPLRPVWRLGQYLLYNLRHQVLFILVPMLLILGAADVVQLYEDRLQAWLGVQFAPDVLIGAAAIVVAVGAPEILRHVWVTQRLPDGPLRDRLQSLCKRLHLRCRDILVWRSGGMIVNAAVMGVIAPLRYVLITDAMIEQMRDEQIEAVFGHEAGHVKHHHIPCFLLFALISGCMVTLFSVYAQGLPRNQYQIGLTVLGLVMLFKWGVVFGWVSRRFERQADTYGVRTLTLAGLPCELPCAIHTQVENPGSPPGKALCATAAQLFGHALNEVAVLNGIHPEARSWRHSSIASRSRFVQTLALDPQRYRRFQRAVLGVQLAIVIAAVGIALWAAYEIRLWRALEIIVERLRS